MTYNQALDYIHALHRFSRKPGLDRIRLLLHKLGDPQRQLKFVHIAGTNGKGSTTVMLAAMLRRAGYHVGCYTSPYVLDFRERIVLDGKMITKGELAELAAEVAEKAAEVEAELEAPREFEFVTALALLFYSRHSCDIVALEVGLGGRFDATNAIDAPLAAVICPIGLDHTELLGDTLAAIAGEKCGIIKHGSMVITGGYQNPEALDVIIESCRAAGCTLNIAQPSQLEITETGLRGSSFFYHGHRFTVSLVGQHQVRNAMTAIDTALALDASGFAVPLTAIEAGIKDAFIPGRLEVFDGTPTVLLDGAHNAHGMAALLESLSAAGVAPKVAVVGMLADKDCADALDIIAPFLQQLIVTTPNSPRALPAAELAELANPYCGKITIEPDCKKAVELALASTNETVLIFGSLYLVSEVRPMLCNPRRLLP